MQGGAELFFRNAYRPQMGVGDHPVRRHKTQLVATDSIGLQSISKHIHVWRSTIGRSGIRCPYFPKREPAGKPDDIREHKTAGQRWIEIMVRVDAKGREIIVPRRSSE